MRPANSPMHVTEWMTAAEAADYLRLRSARPSTSASRAARSRRTASPVDARCASAAPISTRSWRQRESAEVQFRSVCAVAGRPTMVRVKPWKKGSGGWEVDIRLTLPDGSRHRERVKSPVSSKSGSLRWGQQREAVLLTQGGPAQKAEEKPLGEILALEWSDLDFGRGQIKVQRAVYEPKSGKPVVTLPKGGRPRIVPMTARLKRALADHRHLRGARVLYDDDRQPAGKWWLKWQLDVAERRAGLRKGGRVHILRHTFCSRLAAREHPDALDQGAGRSPVAGDNAAVHAPLLSRAARGHRAAGAGRAGGDEQRCRGEVQQRRVDEQ